MKKVIVYFILAILMINFAFSTKVFADEGEVSAEIPAVEAVPEGEVAEEIVLEEEVLEPLIISETAIVTEIGETQEIPIEYAIEKVQKIKIEILDGDYKAKEFETEYVLEYDTNNNLKNYQIKQGDKVTVKIIDDQAGNVTVQVQDIVRTNFVVGMIIAFIIVLAVIFGKHGIKTLLSLVVDGIAVYFLLKGIYAGQNIVLITLLTASIIIVLNSMILNGFNKKTLSLIIGLIITTILTGIIGSIGIYLAKISGITEGVIQLSMNMLPLEFSFQDVKFVVIIFASLGINMNTESIIIKELYDKKDMTADESKKELFKDGMEIGKKNISNTINLISIFFISMTILDILAFRAGNHTYYEILSKESIAEIIVIAVTVSIMSLVAIPIASGIYSILNHKKVIYRTTSENKVDRK